MSKKKKAKKKKDAAKKTKKKAETTSSDILESVSNSMEMAGSAMDFFETSEEAVEEETEVVVHEEADVSEELEATAHDQEEVSKELKAVDQVEGDVPVEGSVEEFSLEVTPNGEEDSDFITTDQTYSIIESLLFASDKPLGVGTFKQVFHGTNIKTKEIKKHLEEMQSVYADSTRGVELYEINGGWQLRTKVDNMPFMRKLAKTRPFKLSGPSLEVLSIIAYKQPLIKMEVDQIRGVESGHLVRALMEKSLVCFQGKSELPGKPMQYGTTRKFLEIFSLRNLKELPSLDEIDQLLPDGIGMEEEPEKLSDVTGDLSKDYEGNYSEGEEELFSISETLEDIDTSSDFFEVEKQRQRDKRDSDRAQDLREAIEVGEEVASKDQRWLTRYDEKMNPPEEIPSEEEAVELSDSELAATQLPSELDL